MRPTESNRNLSKAILVAGLVVGTLDILLAIIQTLIHGGDPLSMFKFIASGVFGVEALKGGLGYSAIGLFFHYCIAMIWTIIFFMIYPKIDWLARNRLLTGLGYGAVVWFGMNQIVLPLSRTPAMSFKLKGAAIGMLILIIAIGIPLSFMAHRFYKSRN